MSRRASLPDRALPPPPRRYDAEVVALQRRVVAQAAEIHRAQGCGRTCPVVRAAEGDEAAFREVVADALRRRNERLAL